MLVNSFLVGMLQACFHRAILSDVLEDLEIFQLYLRISQTQRGTEVSGPVNKQRLQSQFHDSTPL
jgi:hypothetical protein